MQRFYPLLRVAMSCLFHNFFCKFKLYYHLIPGAIYFINYYFFVILLEFLQPPNAENYEHARFDLFQVLYAIHVPSGSRAGVNRSEVEYIFMN